MTFVINFSWFWCYSVKLSCSVSQEDHQITGGTEPQCFIPTQFFPLTLEFSLDLLQIVVTSCDKMWADGSGCECSVYKEQVLWGSLVYDSEFHIFNIRRTNTEPAQTSSNWTSALRSLNTGFFHNWFNVRQQNICKLWCHPTCMTLRCLLPVWPADEHSVTGI